MTAIEFQAFPKISRFNRETLITEKIDGTNAAVGITDEGEVYAQSRKRLISPGKSTDNAGFAGWVADHAERLKTVLGPGLHFGEWYGRGVQRGYGITEDQGADGKFFALFNTSRWTVGGEIPDDSDTETYFPHPYAPISNLGVVPGLTVVPVIGWSPSLNLGDNLDACLKTLRTHGSFATGADGYNKPEGIVIFHGHSNSLFKVTLEKDDAGKGYGG